MLNIVVLKGEPSTLILECCYWDIVIVHPRRRFEVYQMGSSANVHKKIILKKL